MQPRAHLCCSGILLHDACPDNGFLLIQKPGTPGRGFRRLQERRDALVDGRQQCRFVIARCRHPYSSCVPAIIVGRCAGARETVRVIASLHPGRILPPYAGLAKVDAHVEIFRIIRNPPLSDRYSWVFSRIALFLGWQNLLFSLLVPCFRRWPVSAAAVPADIRNASYRSDTSGRPR